MPSSTVSEHAQAVLEDVLRVIRQEYEGPFPVLSETDRNQFVEEERILSEQLRETIESGSNRNSWRDLFGLSSPQAEKCLKDAQELRRRVKNDINAKVRTRLTGRSSLPSPSIYIQGSERTPKTGAGPSRAEGSPGPAIVTSPLNMRCSLLEPVASEVSAGIDEALNSQFETSSESRDGSRDSSTRRHRRSPPPPPRRLTPSIDSRLSSETSSNSGSDSPRRSHSVRRSPPPPPRQLAPSIDSRLSLETSSNLGSESPRRSQSVRRPAPPPPQSPRQSRTPHLPSNVSLSSHGLLPPDPAMIASISQFAQQISTLASSIATESLSTQAPGRRGSRRSGYVTTTKTNCVDITDSNVDGLTLNNGGTNNSGAVIHKTMMPPSRLSPHAPQF